jgi:hypothetical protein
VVVDQLPNFQPPFNSLESFCAVVRGRGSCASASASVSVSDPVVVTQPNYLPMTNWQLTMPMRIESFAGPLAVCGS